MEIGIFEKRIVLYEKKATFIKNALDYYFVFISRYLNDVLIENNERFQISCKEAEYLYRLDIEGCCEDDYGKVKVVAKNENGESEKEVINSCFCKFLLG